MPFCLHPDNAGRTRGYLDRDGQVHWQRIGGLPIGDLVRPRGTDGMGSAELLASLRYMQHRFDHHADDMMLDAVPGNRPLPQNQESAVCTRSR